MKQAKSFVKSYGAFLRKSEKRISGLVEIAAYNSIVSYYAEIGYSLNVKNLGPRKSFRYKMSPTGLIENFSYFEATDPASAVVLSILHNTKIQSAHNRHLYYTPDIAVCAKAAAVTRSLKGLKNRKDSYISNEGLLTFVEVKHLVPFPEVLFGFTGLVQEFAPGFISRNHTNSSDGSHLSPMIVFTGVPSEHAEKIKKELMNRYGINIVYSTQSTDGRIADFGSLAKYNKASDTSGNAACGM